GAATGADAEGAGSGALSGPELIGARLATVRVSDGGSVTCSAFELIVTVFTGTLPRSDGAGQADISAEATSTSLCIACGTRISIPGRIRYGAASPMKWEISAALRSEASEIA